MAEPPEVAENENETPPAPAPPEAAPDEASAISGFARRGAVVVKDRYLIDFDVPIPELETPTAGAFAVSDRQDVGSKLFALISTPGLPVRINVISSIAGDNPRGMLPLIDYDIVYWPPLRQSTMAVIYERPLGGRIAENFDSKNPRISEHDISMFIIDPISTGLGAFSFRNITHRAIRPQNMFYLGEEKTEAVLGDCVTTPPGFDQPTIFETIERGMASPGGRGEASISEDIYALGVAIVFFCNHGNPLEEMSEDDILKFKVEQGSYTALCGKMRIPINLIEALRGMLSDHSHERWETEQISSWINGQRRTPIQKRTAPKADKPFVFADTPHITLRTLANAFTKNAPEAARVIKEPELAEWLRKSFHSQTLCDQTSGLAKSSKIFENKPQGSDDFIVTKLSFAFDPEGPIRYKGLSFMPESYGPFLATELLRQSDLKTPLEIISHNIIGAWFAEQAEYDPEAIALEKFFGHLKKHSVNSAIGGGIERILYELNPGLPCQSPLIAEDYVVYIEDLLPALDGAANRVDAKTPPMDRHIAAFIATRFDQNIAPHLAALASPEEEKSLLGMLSLLAFLQWHLKLNSLFGLSSWLGGLLGPAINTFHSRTTRREIEKELPKLVRKGSLPELFDLIDNIDKRRKDTKTFSVARSEFATAEAEINEIEGGGDTRNAKHVRLSEKIAAMGSILIGMFVITLLAMFRN